MQRHAADGRMAAQDGDARPDQQARLGLVARLGFAAVLVTGSLTAGIYLGGHHGGAGSTLVARRVVTQPITADPDVDQEAADRPIGHDDIAALIGRRAAPADTTGSLPPVTQAVAAGAVPATTAALSGVGPVTGLPLPRFVSLKTDRVNVRQGPTRDHAISFTYQRTGLPVEIVAEFDTWRRIRDADGSEGWVLQNLLSGRRTALVAPWTKAGGTTAGQAGTLPLRAEPDASGGAVALLQPGVLATIKSCKGGWCRLTGEGFDGFMEESRLWGAYPGEAVD